MAVSGCLLMDGGAFLPDFLFHGFEVFFSSGTEAESPLPEA
jgi:hypothetical protein